MEYKASLLPLNKMVDAKLFDNGTLCDNCCSYDCSNPIINLTISVVGVNKKMKVWKTATSRFAVMSCDGFRKDTVVIDPEEDSDND